MYQIVVNTYIFEIDQPANRRYIGYLVVVN